MLLLSKSSLWLCYNKNGKGFLRRWQNMPLVWVLWRSTETLFGSPVQGTLKDANDKLHAKEGLPAYVGNPKGSMYWYGNYLSLKGVTISWLWGLCIYHKATWSLGEHATKMAEHQFCLRFQTTTWRVSFDVAVPCGLSSKRAVCRCEEYYSEVRRKSNWLHNCSYNPLVGPLSGGYEWLVSVYPGPLSGSKK